DQGDGKLRKQKPVRQDLVAEYRALCLHDGRPTDEVLQGHEGPAEDIPPQARTLAQIVVVRKPLLLVRCGKVGDELVTAFDALSLAVSYFIAYQLRINPAFYKDFDLSIAKQLLNDSWPLIFSAVFAMIYLRIDQVMIKEMLGVEEVGIYAAAVKLSEAFYFIPTLLTASLFPAILNAKNKCKTLYITRLQNLYSLLIWLSITAAFIMTFVGQTIVNVLFGEAYYAAGEILIVHIWASIFISISAGFGRYLMAENLTIINMYRVVFGALINIFLNYVLIPIYGGLGAAYATLISLFLVNYIFDIFNKRLWMQLKMKLVAFYYPFILFFKYLKGNFDEKS
ncbi:MAG: flippase, partial [Campylobacterales bacterium]|nr:flippase [Campylobacterales bacterium]